MNYFTKDTDVSILVKFEIDGASVVPDVSSVFYTVRDNAGFVVSGLTDVALTTTTSDTQKAITIPLINNGLSGSHTIEKRSVIVVFTKNGASYELRNQYFLTSWLNMGVTCNDVRNRLGVILRELPDKDIDLVKAYFETEVVIGKVAFDLALSAGDSTQIDVNNAIEILAALMSIPSLQLRVAQNESSDKNSFSRLRTIDFDNLKYRLESQLGDAVTNITGRTDTILNVISVSAQIDPITG